MANTFVTTVIASKDAQIPNILSCGIGELEREARTRSFINADPVKCFDGTVYNMSISGSDNVKSVLDYDFKTDPWGIAKTIHHSSVVIWSVYSQAEVEAVRKWISEQEFLFDKSIFIVHLT